MFVQKIFFTTKKEAEVQKLLDDFDGINAPGNPSIWFLKDRDKPDGFVISAAFDSYDEAMLSNERPQTQRFATKFRALCLDEPIYVNLDVISMV